MLLPTVQTHAKVAKMAAPKGIIGQVPKSKRTPKPRKAAAKPAIVDDTETEGEGDNDSHHDKVLSCDRLSRHDWSQAPCAHLLPAI